MHNLLYPIALTLLPKVGSKTARTLISYCGSAQAVFEASKRELLAIPTVNKNVVEAILQKAVLSQAEEELKFIAQNGIQAFSFMDADYPTRLKKMPTAPIVLYSKGRAHLNAPKMLGIVGTRRPSYYGIERCKELVRDMSCCDIMTISGLAYGVDVTAHKASIKNEIPTIAVVAHGLDQIYPASHRSIAQSIIDSGGAILSEYPSCTRPDRERFPMRNRIIAGLSDALVVVESGAKGGSMITARYAINMHKQLFTYPGRVTDPLYAGNHLLLKKHEAHLLQTAEDIIDSCDWQAGNAPKGVQQQLFTDLSVDEAKIIQLLQTKENPNIDDLCFHSGQSNSQVASHLLQLEFKGVIRSMPGKRYALVQ